MARPLYTLEGFDGFRKGLKKADLGSKLKEINREVARELIVAAEAKRSALKAEFPAYKKVTLKPSAAANRVQIIVGPKTVAFSAEFGAYVHPVHGSVRSQTGFRSRVWPSWTGNDEEAGLMVYPSLREREAEIRDIYDRVTEQVLFGIATEA